MGHLPGVGRAGEEAGRPPPRGQDSAPNPPPPTHMRTKSACHPIPGGLAGWGETVEETGVHLALLLNSVKMILKLVPVYFEVK